MSARCSTCGAPILWAKTAKGKPMPLDAEPRDDGNVVLERGVAIVIGPLEHVTRRTEPLFVSHLATCPQAKDHRKGR